MLGAVDLRQLEIIRAIAETGSFTAAGNKLHVSQSAISRQILLLEDELKEAVFLRVGRRIRITPARACRRRGAACARRGSRAAGRTSRWQRRRR